jgi:hypothetical protein
MEEGCARIHRIGRRQLGEDLRQGPI